MMAFLTMRWRAEMRSRWRSVVVLSLLVGLGGGMALTALSGARRADTAVPRFLAYSRPGTGAVFFGDSPVKPPEVRGPAAASLAPAPYARAVLSLPQVQAYYRVMYLFTVTNGDRAGVVNTFGLVDQAATRAADRPLVVSGRLPDPRDPFEVSVNEMAAAKLHLRVGSRLHVQSFSAAQLASGDLGSGMGPGQGPAGPAYTVRVAAVVRFFTDVSAIVPLAAKQDVVYEGQQNVYLGPAFAVRLAHDLGRPVQQLPSMNVFGVRLRHGASDWEPFVTAARKLNAHSTVPVNFQTGDPVGIPVAAHSAARGIGVEVTALMAFGALAALVTLLLVGQAASRQLRADAGDRGALWAIGATRIQMAASAMIRPAVVAVTGAALSFVVAALASPLMPLGLAGKAEIHPGFEVNTAILLGGAGLLALLLLARSAIPAWRSSRPVPADAGSVLATVRPGALDRWCRIGSAPLSPVVGVRFAFGSARGRSSGAMLTALVGAIAAVAGLSAALTFGTSLRHLVHDPGQQGWNWDVLVGSPNNTTDDEVRGGALLASNPMVTSYSAVSQLGSVPVDGVNVPEVLGIDRLKGSVQPPLLEGRAPAGPDEIALATHTLQELHKHVGQTVQVDVGNRRQIRLRIVGRMLAPSVGDLLTNGLGDGGWIDGSLIHQQWRNANDPAGIPPPGTDGFEVFALRLAPGAPRAAALASLRRDFGPTVLEQLPAEDAVNLQSVSGLPFALAALIALLGAATVGHALVSSVRERRRDLAVLKTLGFVRGQVTATVAWQATSFATVALVVGVPLGLASGRWAWTAVASSIYSVSPPLIPALAVALVLPATLLVCNLIAAGPARAAGRLAPALAMRSE